MTDDLNELEEMTAMKPIDISKDIVASLGSIYNPLFDQIRIYGTVNDPLFVAKDVQQALGIKNIRYKDDTLFEWGSEKLKTKITTDRGIRDAIVFTEEGLYRALYSSSAEIAKIFRKYVLVVLKKLRIDGKVNVDQAQKLLATELERQRQTIEGFTLQLDQQNVQLKTISDDNELKSIQLYEASRQIDAGVIKIKNSKCTPEWEMADRLHRVQKHYMKPLTVYLHRPPKNILDYDIYDYDLDNFVADDVDLIDKNSCMIWSFSLSFKKDLKIKIPICKIYLHKEITLDMVSKAFELYLLDKFDKKKLYTMDYETIEICINDLNKRVESTW